MKLNEYDLKCLIEDNYIKTDEQRKWFNDILPHANIRVYTNETPEQRKDYDAYCSIHNLDIKEFRGTSWSNGDIILNGFNETEASLCWILLHELGHVEANLIADKFDYDILEILSGGSLQNLSKEEYAEYCLNDDVHEARFEEVFANQFANIIIGKCYDRHWWRKNKQTQLDKEIAEIERRNNGDE